jgi:Ca2+-transporting ATPase
VPLAQTAAFAAWLLGHIMRALNLKQERRPLLRQGLLANRFAAGWLLGMIALSVVMTTVPLLREALKTAALPGPVWGAIIAMVLASTWWIELGKWPGRASGSATRW